MRTFLLAGAFLAAAVAARAATTYTYTNIADTSATYSSFAGSPVGINQSGLVVFRAQLAAGGEGIFVGNGGAVTTIATSGSPYRTFVNAPSINDAGEVAFTAQTVDGGTGVFVGSGGPVQTAYAEATHYASSNPAISAGGLIAVRVSRQNNPGDQRLLLLRGAAPVTIADTAGQFLRFADDTDTQVFAVNDAGQVAFRAELDAGGSGIYVGSASSLTTIAATADGRFSAFKTNISMNASGTVAFQGTLQGGGEGLYAGAGGALTTLVDSAGPFASFRSISLNDSGAYAFQGDVDGGGGSVFAGLTLADNVLPAMMFGSSVTSFAGISVHSLNNRGQVTFFYQLADGRSGIAVATPQTPGGPTPTPPPATAAPQITSALSAAAQSGQPFTYQITATNSPARYAAADLPAGFEVDAATGLITGGTVITGVSNVTLTAANAVGSSAPAVLALTVSPDPNAGSEANLAGGVTNLKVKLNGGGKLKVKGSFILMNPGAAKAKKFRILPFISTDPKLSADDQALSAVTGVAGVPAQLSGATIPKIKAGVNAAPQPFSMVFPAASAPAVQGKYLLFHLDADDVVKESNELDNVTVIGPLTP